jgi:glycerophosphoryl diester phosphodiesterase
MRSKLAALLSLTIVGAALGPAVASTPARAAACVTVPATAHRGGTERYVENTRNAFRDARNRGAAIWETDVQFTADNVPVIMHDDTIDRTTNGTGAVASLTWAQLSTARTADDQPIPTLADLVNDAQVDNAKVLVELKTNPTDAQWATFLDAMASRTGMTGKLVITSFDPATLTAAAEHAPAYARGLISELGDIAPAAVTPYASILVKHHNAITSARMAAWTAGGLSVYSWTVDTTAEWDRMSWYPALAGVITNLPAGYIAWQKARVC